MHFLVYSFSQCPRYYLLRGLSSPTLPGCICEVLFNLIVRRYPYMYYLALACDYDGTLAKDGVVSSKTRDALERVGASGRKLMLVTGRLLEDLQRIFPRLDLFTYVVAENGALLYHPASSTEQLLGEAPSKQFLQALQERGVPLSTGRVIVATWHPHETAVVDVI